MTGTSSTGSITEPAAANADGVIVGGANGSGVMFDAIADRYDRLNRILSLGLDRGWRRKAIKAMALRPGARVLDLATGTADLALAAAAAERVHVIGLDPSAGMLAQGRSKVDEAGFEQSVELRVGDAQALDFPDSTFDAVGIAFGIRNVPDRAAALREMARVSVADGRVVILELSEPTGPLGAAARLYLHHLVPRIGALLSGRREYRYLQQSIAAFPPAGEFAQLMESCGLEVLALRPLTFGVSHLYVARPR